MAHLMRLHFANQDLPLLGWRGVAAGVVQIRNERDRFKLDPPQAYWPGKIADKFSLFFLRRARCGFQIGRLASAAS